MKIIQKDYTFLLGILVGFSAGIILIPAFTFALIENLVKYIR